MESISTTLLCFAVTLLLSSGWVRTSAYGHDYRDALAKSILFYEGQRSGKLPPSQRATWRADSGLKDGHSEGVNLVGGYYDAGDNVKFGLPMAFTITMLSWSVVEYGSQMSSSGELSYALEAIKWGSDYLLNAHPEPNVLWGEVGDGVSDHECWQRPEDMTTPRQAYKIDANNPGSDLAGETAAAMAAASLALRNSNKGYASVLVQHAKQLFSFADTHRGKYDSSISIARSFYQSKSGYADELLWASMWLYEATGENYYLDYAMENAASLGGTSWAMTEFSWDVKYAGLQVLASKVLLRGDKGSDRNVLMKYQSKAEFFLCACLQKNQGKNVQRTPGGLLYVRPWNNMQYVTGAAFLMTVYSDYLSASKQSLKCSAGSVASSELLTAARSQIDYILGNNPRATSYLVGYGSNYPQRVHHRGSSIVSYHVDSEFVSCKAGYANWFGRSGADPNVLVGAIVGGPDQNDNYADARNNYEQSEPATYNNAPLIGVLARLHAGGDYYSAQFYIKPSAMQATSQSLPLLRRSSSLPGTNRPQKRQNGSSNSAIISIAQNMTSSWTFRGQALYRYEASLTNNSPLQQLEQVVLTVDGLKGPLWGLTKVGPNSFTFPVWAKSLPPKQKLSFVYIHAVPEPASVTISTSTFA